MHTKEISMPKRLVADPDALTYNYGKFVAEPLRRGFGITIGNSLRRVLLSSIKGAAVTAVKIDGVLHEFATIPGVVEDVVQIVLNLKEIRFKLMDDGPVTLYLDAKGVGEVTAADIQLNSRIEVMNPDQHIATLDKNGALEMEIYVDAGRGYISLEDEEEDTAHAPGIIPIDSIFSPIRKVNFKVEPTMLPNHDRLLLEVWTDGSISAKDAIAEAAEILKEHLDMFIEFDETYVEEEEEISEEMEKRRMYLSKPVAELELTVRAANCLAAADIITIRDLVTKTEAEMLKYRNFGRKSLNELKTLLSEMGLSFGMVLDNEEGKDKSKSKDKSKDKKDEDIEETETEEPEDAS